MCIFAFGIFRVLLVFLFANSFRFFIIFSMLLLFAPYIFLPLASCHLPLLIGRFILSLFWNVPFFRYCFIMLASIFPRVVGYIFLMWLFSFYPNMFLSYSFVLSFWLFIVDLSTPFTVKFLIQVSSFCYRIFGEPQFFHRQTPCIDYFIYIIFTPWRFFSRQQ